MTAIHFVCLGNICRSPLAEGVLRHKIEQAGLGSAITLDSAGCGGWHAGRRPDPRSIAVAAQHGVTIDNQRARLLTATDFSRFDLILGMDHDNVRHLMRLQSPYCKARIGLYLEEALGERKDVPDPYGGDAEDFEHVFSLCDRASDGLLAKLALA